MKIRNIVALAAVAVLVGACIPSVNPFYTRKDIVFDSGLLGEWQEKDKADAPEIWKFEKAGDEAYKLTVTEKEGKQGEFSAHLFKLGDNRFLDLIPDNCDYATNQADLVAFAMFPGHLLVQVPELGPELKLAFFDFDWLQKYLEENPTALAHHTEDKRILLTATTDELQQFVLAHLGAGGLFDKVNVMVRKTNAVSTAAAPQ